MIHELKILPTYFELMAYRGKRFELRKEDAGKSFVAGNDVCLREWTELHGYTGRSIEARIAHVLRPNEFPPRMAGALGPGWVIVMLEDMLLVDGEETDMVSTDTEARLVTRAYEDGRDEGYALGLAAAVRSLRDIGQAFARNPAHAEKQMPLPLAFALASDLVALPAKIARADAHDESDDGEQPAD